MDEGHCLTLKISWMEYGIPGSYRTGGFFCPKIIEGVSFIKKSWLIIVSLIIFFIAFAFDVLSAQVKRDLEAQNNIKVLGGDAKESKIAKSIMKEIMVTATRVETSAEELASSVTIITQDDIRNMQAISVQDAIKDTPGLEVVRRGGLGAGTSVYVRGAKPEHTLVLIDGVEMNDPVSPGRSYDFLSQLSTDNIERIEILRGPQSTLYGSDAMGGVINIITKKGKGKPFFYITSEGGSFCTFRESAGVSGGNKLMYYSVSASRLETGGISSAGKKYGNKEEDGYKNTSVSMRFGLVPSNRFKFDFILKHVDSRFELDNFGGLGGDDPNYVGHAKQLFLNGGIKIGLMGGIWEQKIDVRVGRHERHYDNSTDVNHPKELLESAYNAQLLVFSWQNNIYLNESNTFMFGIETEEERACSKDYSLRGQKSFSSLFGNKTARVTGYYLQDQLKFFDRVFIALGVRVDDHDRFGSKVTYHAAPAFVINETGTKIKGTLGTGFKAPSLYQLYSLYGNDSLRPEESLGWEVGFEQSFFRSRLKVGALYFRNDFDNLIEFYYTMMPGRYKNAGKAKTKGVEIFSTFSLTKNLNVKTSYTYTQAKNETTGENLLLRAKHNVGIRLNYNFFKAANINFGLSYVGKRDDELYSIVGNGEPLAVKLGGYTLLKLAASYDISKNVRVFSRLENVLDKAYEEVAGYGTSGISAFLGIKMSF